MRMSLQNPKSRWLIDLFELIFNFHFFIHDEHSSLQIIQLLQILKKEKHF